MRDPQNEPAFTGCTHCGEEDCPGVVERAEFDEVERERDAAWLEIERLNGVVYDLHERCNMERERADEAAAGRIIYVHGLGDTA